VGDATGTRLPPADDAGDGTPPASVETRGREMLASLDFEDVSTRPRGARSLEATQPGHHARMQRMRWFAYGILVGTVGSVMGAGGAEALLHATCDWSSGALRAFGCGAVDDAPPFLPMGLAVAPGPSAGPAIVPTVRVDDLPPAAKDPGPDSRGPTRAP
jgi:hypothetical protein